MQERDLGDECCRRDGMLVEFRLPALVRPVAQNPVVFDVFTFLFETGANKSFSTGKVALKVSHVQMVKGTGGDNVCHITELFDGIGQLMIDRAGAVYP